jgi:hypothetical protein
VAAAARWGWRYTTLRAVGQQGPLRPARRRGIPTRVSFLAGAGPTPSERRPGRPGPNQNDGQPHPACPRPRPGAVQAVVPALAVAPRSSGIRRAWRGPPSSGYRANWRPSTHTTAAGPGRPVASSRNSHRVRSPSRRHVNGPRYGRPHCIEPPRRPTAVPGSDDPGGSPADRRDGPAAA